MQKQINTIILIIIFTVLNYIIYFLQLYIIFMVSKLLRILNININIYSSSELFGYIFQFALLVIFFELLFYKNFIKIFYESQYHKKNYVIDTDNYKKNNLALILIIFILSALFSLFLNIYNFIYFFNVDKNFLVQYNNINYNLKNILNSDFIISILLSPFIEEYYFRIRFDNYCKYFKKSDWLLLNAYVFAIVHTSNPILVFLRFFETYLLLSISYVFFRNYLFNVLIHSLLNFLTDLFNYKNFFYLAKYFFHENNDELYLSFYSFKTLIIILFLILIILIFFLKILRNSNLKNNKLALLNYF